MPSLLVVTDLDGTLLDHFDYGHAAARQALAALRERGFPVVCNSSKTRSELHQLREELGNAEPYVVENGAALYLPTPDGGEERRLYGCERRLLIDTLAELAFERRFRYQPFSSMTPASLVQATGLDVERAGMALNREHSEPLLWHDSPSALAIFATLLEERGLRLTRGGRFVHVSGRADKGSCLPELVQWYARRDGITPVVLALGDGINDLPLLAAADIAVQVRSPVHGFPDFSHKRLMRTQRTGPEGWNDAVLEVLALLPSTGGSTHG